MRLFVAFDVDEKARAAAGRVSADLRARLERQGVDRASWVKADNLHFTVRFLGELDEGQANSVREALAPPFDVVPFEAAMTRVGVFPGATRPRVLWLGVSEGAGPMASLHALVENRLKASGFAPESRAFAAHLTLARFRDLGRPLPPAARAIVDAPLPESIRFRIDHVTLYESRLSPKGSRYTSLVEAQLTASGS